MPFSTTRRSVRETIVLLQSAPGMDLLMLAAPPVVEVRVRRYFGLAIGFCLVAGGYAAGSVSGALLNPALAIGVDVASGDGSWSGFYALCELAGAAIVTLARRFIIVLCPGVSRISGNYGCNGLYRVANPSCICLLKGNTEL